MTSHHASDSIHVYAGVMDQARRSTMLHPTIQALGETLPITQLKG